MIIVDQSPSSYRPLFRAVENFFGLYREEDGAVARTTIRPRSIKY
jgi:hypothetical protein